MTTHPGDRVTEILLPTQPGPSQVRAAATPTEPVDHVRRHGARCYWDHRECCWVCAR
jgi:hypothetical protein